MVFCTEKGDGVGERGEYYKIINTGAKGNKMGAQSRKKNARATNTKAVKGKKKKSNDSSLKSLALSLARDIAIVDTNTSRKELAVSRKLNRSRR